MTTHEGFTPGPWEVDGDSVQGELHIRPAGTGWLLAVVYLDGITAEYQNVTADARLIADAPRLYAENQRLAKIEAAARDLMENRAHTPTTYNAAMDALRAALNGEDK